MLYAGDQIDASAQRASAIGGVVIVAVIGAAEVIRVVVDIEANTRETGALLRELIDTVEESPSSPLARSADEH